MSEERKKILEMLSSGKISTEEAERLLDAIKDNNGTINNTVSATVTDKRYPKYLIVKVKSDEENGKHTNVNIRVPFQMIRAGVKLASLIPKDAKDKIDEAMDEKGVKFDFDTLLQSDNMQEVLDAIADMTIDVNDGKTIIKVACE